MAARNSARNTARKSASLKAVPANADQGAPDPVSIVSAKIASALSAKAMDVSLLIHAIARANASGLPAHKNGDEDLDVGLLAQIGEKMASELAESLDFLNLALNGHTDLLAKAAESAGVTHD